MFRKAIIALTAAIAVGVAFIPTESMAFGRGGGGSHGFGGGHGFGGRGFAGHGFAGRGFAGHGFSHRGFRGGFGPGWGFYGAPYGYYAGGYGDDGCVRLRRVMTPYGWRWQRIYVCY